MSKLPSIAGLSDAEIRAMAKADIRFYALLIRDVANCPMFQFDAPVAAMADELQAIADGKQKRLMISIMPQFGKTTLTADIFLTWLLGRNPRHRFAYATYAEPLAMERGTALLRIMQSPLYQALFPETALDKNSQSKTEFKTTVGGGIRCIGRGQSLTGFTVNGILLDDTLKGQKEADSDAVRKDLHTWYTGDVMSRIKEDGPPEAHDWLIHIGTRWHVDDLIGWAQRNQAHHNWKVLAFAALLENGESFCPNRKTTAFLLKTRDGMSSRQWSALYMQRPVPAEGATFQLSQFKRYNRAMLPPKFDHVVQSIDTAQKAAEVNDPSVIETWGIVGNKAYLLNVLCKRMPYPTLKRTVLDHAKWWSADFPSADLVLIEDKSSGISLIQDLANESMPCPVVGITPDGSKEMRAVNVSDLVEGGYVYLPEAAPWLADFEYEVSCFPIVTHDDQVDALSQFLAWFKKRMHRVSVAGRAGRPRVISSTFTSNLELVPLG